MVCDKAVTRPTIANVGQDPNAKPHPSQVNEQNQHDFMKTYIEPFAAKLRIPKIEISYYRTPK